ncbi:MAG: hypothetical protein BWY57_02528 [Betaproteobacteria bacterium ADurb.Bin341]|nr:MAG: hypothetical protein BWY57_02528 [Betaproteobacteria bacterium ADurb.Bin341]
MVEGTPTPTPRLEGTANLSAHLIVAHAMRHTCLLHRPVENVDRIVFRADASYFFVFTAFPP